MKKRKKIKSTKSKITSNSPSIQDFIVQEFWQKVIQDKPKKITPSMTLMDLVPDKRFKQEFLEMYVDRTELLLGMSIRRIKNKPLVDIFKFLGDLKQKKIMFGWK